MMEFKDLLNNFLGSTVFTILVLLGLVALAVYLKLFLRAPSAEYKHDKNQ